jgi:hypothetical protein
VTRKFSKIAEIEPAMHEKWVISRVESIGHLRFRFRVDSGSLSSFFYNVKSCTI